MPSPRFEVLSGTIDGVNTVYTVSVPYKAGSTALFVNGLLQRIDLDDGWTETSPLTGTVTLNEAPRSGPSGGGDSDVLQLFFLDTSPPVLETVTTTLRGTIEPEDVLEGSLLAETAFLGVVETSSLEGSLSLETLLTGEVVPETDILGTLEVCA